MTGPATFCRDKHHIDGTFSTRDIEFTDARFLALRDGHGDHRSVLIDVTYRSLIGKERLVLERPQARRLQFTIPLLVRKYIKTLCRLIDEANFYEQVRKVYSKVNFPIHKKVQGQADNLDKL